MSHVNEALQKSSQPTELAPSPESYYDFHPVTSHPVISMFLKRKRLFIAVSLTFFIICCIVVFLLPKKYQSEMKLLVKNERQDLIVSPDSNTNTTRSSDPSENDINSEIEILRSRDVLRKVALQSGLSLPERGTVQAAGEVSPVSLDKAITTLAKDLSITAVKKSNIIDVTYTSKNPQTAGTVLAKLEDAYLEIHLKMHAAPGSYNFFEEQARAFNERLKRSQDELQAFQEKNSGLVQADEDQTLTTHAMDSQASLEQIDAQIADYQFRITQDKKALASLDPRVVTQVRTIPQAQLIGNLNQTLIELRNKQTDAIAKFRPDDRRITELNQQISDTTTALNTALQQISTEKQTDSNPVHQEAEKDLLTNQIALSGLLARRAAVSQTVTVYQQKMFRLAGATIQRDQLMNQVKENLDNYLLYEKKREEARIAESLDKERITNVAIVQAPEVPVRPSGPNRKLDLLLSLICATFLGSVAVVTAESLTQKPPEPRPVQHLLTAATTT